MKGAVVGGGQSERKGAAMSARWRSGREGRKEKRGRKGEVGSFMSRLQNSVWGANPGTEN